jgi:hypothetical protein
MFMLEGEYSFTGTEPAEFGRRLISWVAQDTLAAPFLWFKLPSTRTTYLTTCLKFQQFEV